MLRWMTPFLVEIFAIGTAAAEGPGATKTADDPAAAKPADSSAAAKPADNSATANPATAKPADSPAAIKPANSPAVAKRAAVRAARQLPPGLPRAHYNYRTTVAPGAAPLYVRRGRALVVEEEDPDVLFTPVGVVPYAPRVFARRCCRAHRRCRVITAPAIPTAMTAPITAARPMVRT